MASLNFTVALANCALTQTQSRPNVGVLLQRLPSADDTERDVIMDELDKIKAPDEIVPAVLTALDQVDPRKHGSSWTFWQVGKTIRSQNMLSVPTSLAGPQFPPQIQD